MHKLPVIIFSLTSLLFAADLSIAKDTTTLQLPPESLSQWYKPENKRQVWLHTMFRLRRSMQAIESYAADNNQPNMNKWFTKLEQDYLKISEMVPEWKNEIKPRLLPELQLFIDSGDTPRIRKTLQMIQRTCNDCHDKYQPLATAIYRSPGYDEIKIKDLNGKVSNYDDQMEELSRTVNHVLIALEDNRNDHALQASKKLGQQLNLLGDSCQQCHKDDPVPQERILGTGLKKKLNSLQADIKNNRVKESRKLMGEIGVMVCARCHNTHRILSDLRNTLLD